MPFPLGGRLWHVPQPTAPWCPCPVPAKFSPAVKTFSQKTRAVPGLCSFPSDIEGKDPAPQIPGTYVGKSQGFTNRERCYHQPFAFHQSNQIPPNPASPLQPPPCALVQLQPCLSSLWQHSTQVYTILWLSKVRPGFAGPKKHSPQKDMETILSNHSEVV